MSYVAVERIDLRELDYATFLAEFVAKQRPLILTGVGQGWPARERWSLRWFEAALDGDEALFVRLFRAQGTSLAEAKLATVLSELLEPSLRDYRIYSSNWHFYRRHPELDADYCCPQWFRVDGSAAFQADALRWIYFGEAGTGTETHIDVLRSSAWLYLFEGRKQWRFVSGADARALLDRPGPVPELFELEPCEARSVFVADQGPGDLVWTPPASLHAVRNLTTTLALTHNYVDLTNAAIVLGSPGLADEPQRAWVRQPDTLERWLAELVGATRRAHPGEGEAIAGLIRAQLEREPRAPRAALEAAAAALVG